MTNNNDFVEWKSLTTSFYIYKNKDSYICIYYKTCYLHNGATQFLIMYIYMMMIVRS